MLRILFSSLKGKFEYFCTEMDRIRLVFHLKCIEFNKTKTNEKNSDYLSAYIGKHYAFMLQTDRTRECNQNKLKLGSGN